MNAILPSSHSPLGASGSHRWMTCPGSVGLSYGADDEEDDTYSLPGTAAHALAELCMRERREPWSYIGYHYGNMTATYEDKSEEVLTGWWSPAHIIENAVECDKEMADAVQVYLDYIRTRFPDRNQGNTWVERAFHCPTIHDYFYGTSDFNHLMMEERTLHIIDFKYGAGIVVEADDNPQLKYYAAGVLEELRLWEDVDEVVLHISQPRGFHYAGPNRSWRMPVSDLIAWLEDILVPAMNTALVSRDTQSGEHCRFCPARFRACPQLVKDMTELETMIASLDGKTAEILDNDQLSKFMNLIETAKIVGKAAGQTAFKRMSAGHPIPGWKLAKAKSNREFKDGAEEAAKKLFKDGAYTERKLKSPAQIEEMPGGDAFCAQYAFKPDKGLTLVRDDDSRPAVNKDTKSLFQPVDKKKRAKAG